MFYCNDNRSDRRGTNDDVFFIHVDKLPHRQCLNDGNNMTVGKQLY